MLRLVCNVRAKIPPNNAMPSWVVLLVKFFLDVSSYVFLDVELFHSLCGTLHSICLHILRHVGIFYHGFPVGHLENRNVISRQGLYTLHIPRKTRVPPLKTTPMLESKKRNGNGKRIELLTLSKNSFPQLTQTFATEIPFSNNYLKVKQIQHRFLLEVYDPRHMEHPILDLLIGLFLRPILVAYINPRCIARRLS